VRVFAQIIKKRIKKAFLIMFAFVSFILCSSPNFFKVDFICLKFGLKEATKEEASNTHKKSIKRIIIRRYTTICCPQDPSVSFHIIPIKNCKFPSIIQGNSVQVLSNFIHILSQLLRA
jgi:hypothetical protein